MSQRQHRSQSRSNVSELLVQEFDNLEGSWVGLADANGTEEAKNNGRWLVMDSEHAVNTSDMA